MNKIEKISALTVAGILFLGSSVFAKTGIVNNTTEGLVLRGSASKSGEPLATVKEGAEVEIIEENGEWYKVNANGKEGYLFAEYVKVQEEQETLEDTANDGETDSPDTIKTETKIHLLPVISSTTIGTIPAEGELSIEKTVGNWDYVTYENIKGWVRTSNVSAAEVKVPDQTEEEEPKQETETETQEEQPSQEETNTSKEDTNVSFRKGYVNSSSVNVRKEPNTSSEIVTTLILNTGVNISAQTDEWYKIVYGDYMGYIHKSLISETPTASSRSQEPRTVTVEKTQTQNTTQEQAPAVTTSTDAGEKIVSFAKQYLGYSYVYGGTTPSGGFDCSGFVYYVFNSCGYSLSRSCTVQAQSGTAVSKAELQPGDIIFFNNTSNGSIGHVGIYIGDGRFIHASNPTRGVVTDTINSGYYYTYYYSARRIV